MRKIKKIDDLNHDLYQKDEKKEKELKALQIENKQMDVANSSLRDRIINVEM